MTTFQEGGARWLCCHLGAREHYAVPRALHRRGRLGLLVTDAWVRPGSLWSRMPGDLPRRLSERFHPDLTDTDVRDFTLSAVAREAFLRAGRGTGWKSPMDRNRWFGRRAARVLNDVAGGEMTTVFAHSYSAREVFAHAKTRGWTTVLGQIDPGEEHFRVARLASDEWTEYGAAPEAPPAAYFDSWREECALADRIIVNSPWSREALTRAGIPAEKLRVLRLVYEPEETGPVAAHQYPDAFTPARPLRVLFVGHAAVAKGVPALLEAVEQMTDVPVELHLVGAISMVVPWRFAKHPAIRWVGAVSRSEVMRHYRESDVLVFPSLSDGFGMAQVEAQAWRLPIIASRHCGRVVEDGVNGLLLPEVSAGAIAATLRRVAGTPALLAEFSRHSGVATQSGIEALSAGLLSLESA
ncbi:MAG: glycosyltransferase family 4 protein [Acidobacteriota bacterium]|nr:glycosyltransferase family 4 protein [Acidobacteriota bacterium]